MVQGSRACSSFRALQMPGQPLGSLQLSLLEEHSFRQQGAGQKGGVGRLSAKCLQNELTVRCRKQTLSIMIRRRTLRSAFMVCVNILAPFSYLLYSYHMLTISTPESSHPPASTCSRSPPCRGRLPRTVSGATGTTGGSALSSFLPATKPCRIQ